MRSDDFSLSSTLVFYEAVEQCCTVFKHVKDPEHNLECQNLERQSLARDKLVHILRMGLPMQLLHLLRYQYK
jgi:hypothetical protein